MGKQKPIEREIADQVFEVLADAVGAYMDRGLSKAEALDRTLSLMARYVEAVREAADKRGAPFANPPQTATARAAH